MTTLQDQTDAREGELEGRGVVDRGCRSVIVPVTSRSKTDSRFASMSTLAWRKKPADEISAIALDVHHQRDGGVRAELEVEVRDELELAARRSRIAPKTLALANPSRVRLAVDDGDDVRPGGACSCRRAGPSPSSQLIVATSGPVPDTRFGDRAADRVAAQLAGGAAGARDETVEQVGRQRARVGDAFERGACRDRRGSRRARPAGASVMSLPELLKITRAYTSTSRMSRLMPRLTVKSPATPCAVEDQHADRADAQDRVGRADVRPDRHLAEREQAELLRVRVEVDAEEEDAVDAGDAGDLDVARELHLDEGALEVDDHRVGGVAGVQEDSPGSPVSSGVPLWFSSESSSKEKLALKSIAENAAPSAPSAKPRFSATARRRPR